MGAMEGEASFTEAELEALLGVYDASIRDLDQALGRLLDGLESRDALDDTIIVVVGDHGEHFGEDGRFDHRWSVHQALLHVPLVVHGPGVAHERVQEPVSTMGLFGTLPELAGLPAPRADAPTLDARGPVFSVLVAPTPRLPEVLATWPDLPAKRWQVRYGAVVDGPLKFVRDDKGGEWLFDVVADPLQTGALDRPDEAARLGTLLASWRRSQPRYDPSLRGPGDRPGRPMEQDEATRAQLEALGYFSGDE
jgi:arylsulfatase A-like enzyme